jgi:hypothetical protein
MQDPAQRRQVKMTAHLVEKDDAAFARLAALQAMFPDVEIIPHHGDFTQVAPRIAGQLAPSAFSFVLIDPKGWSVDLVAIRPLIARENCEVVFNFMFDFINRFALSDDPAIAGQLDRLIPGRDWRAAIRAIDREKQGAGHTASDARKGVGPDRSSVSLREEETRARILMQDLAPDREGTISWGALWPVVLSRCVVRLTDLKRLANEDRRAGVLEFPTWPSASKRVPEDDYPVRRRRVGGIQTSLL